jgi:hypothetical protein
MEQSISKDASVDEGGKFTFQKIVILQVQMKNV